MNIEDYRDYCLKKKGVTEETPFGPDTLVFKVMGKMFALSGIDDFKYINLKCEPDIAINLRETYESVRPGYHMNKQLWNSVYIDGDVTDEQIYQMIDDSYQLIVKSLTKKLQAELAEV